MHTLHSIPCSSCNLQYVGEHKYYIHKHNRNKPIAKHISDQDHPLNINNAKTVKIMNKVRQRKVIESFIIIKKTPNMNVYQCSINLDHFTSSILLNNVPSLRKLLNSLENCRFF